jgi:predicted nucleic-acid-binding Zn-ribbon protein
MKPFDPNAVCPKCGNTNIATRFKPAGVPKADYVGRRFEHDTLRRVCQGCGYTWHELPLDAGEEQR